MAHDDSRRCGRARIAVLCLALAAGCNAASREARQENHPLMRRAITLKNADDIEGAIAAYHAALENNPRLTRAHLDLGLLYDKREDYLRAYHHYQRYLEVGDFDEKLKRTMVEDLARRARLAFAAQMTPTPPGAVEMIAALRKENALLRAELEDRAVTAGRAPPPHTASGPMPPAADGGEPSGAAPPVAPPPPILPPPPPAPAAAQMTTYTVRPGDTLYNIAAKLYGDRAAWQKLYEANRAVIPDPTRLRVGVTLTVPRP